MWSRSQRDRLSVTGWGNEGPGPFEGGPYRIPECILYLCIVVSLHNNPDGIMLAGKSEKRPTCSSYQGGLATSETHSHLGQFGLSGLAVLPLSG